MKREETRRQESRPLVDAFFAWCDEQAALVLDDTPISKALGYARNQRAALSRFIDDGRLPPDNNVSEQRLKGLTVVRIAGSTKLSSGSAPSRSVRRADRTTR